MLNFVDGLKISGKDGDGCWRSFHQGKEIGDGASKTRQFFFFWRGGRNIPGSLVHGGKSEEICLAGMEGLFERIVRNKIGEELGASCLITIKIDLLTLNM